MGSSIRDVRAAIEKWNLPVKPTSEAKCKTALAAFLSKELDVQPTKEFGVGRLRIDIHLDLQSGWLDNLFGADKECYIELKYGFQTRPKLQRLIGQIHQYLDADLFPLIIVLCGECDDGLVAELRSFLKKDGVQDDWGDRRIWLCVKSYC